MKCKMYGSSVSYLDDISLKVLRNLPDEKKTKETLGSVDIQKNDIIMLLLCEGKMLYDLKDEQWERIVYQGRKETEEEGQKIIESSSNVDR